jgi:hypothetical protein
MSITLAGTKTCQWTGIRAASITGTCDQPATLTGQNISSGQQDLCTEHMIERDRAGYGYTWVWPCLANGYTRDSLPATAAARCR